MKRIYITPTTALLEMRIKEPLMMVLSKTEEEKDGGSALADEYTPGHWEGIWDNMNASEQ